MIFLHELDDFLEVLVLEDVHLIEQLLLPIPVVNHPILLTELFGLARYLDCP